MNLLASPPPPPPRPPPLTAQNMLCWFCSQPQQCTSQRKGISVTRISDIQDRFYLQRKHEEYEEYIQLFPGFILKLLRLKGLS